MGWINLIDVEPNLLDIRLRELFLLRVLLLEALTHILGLF